MFGGLQKLKNKLTTQKKVPKEVAQPVEPKLNYKERMMKRYKLSEDDFKKAKKEAAKQKENWLKYKKEQVLDIFSSKSKYVSKSISSDAMHPKAYRAVTPVMNKEGKEVHIEFGKRLELLLETSRPNPKFALIRSHLVTEKSKKNIAIRFKRRHGLTIENRERSKEKKEKYETMKSSLNMKNSTTTRMDDTVRSDTSLSVGVNDETTILNSTDQSKKVFPKDWYEQSSAKNLIKGKKSNDLTFWMGEVEDSQQASDLEDDDQSKYAITSDIILEVLEGKRKIEISNYPKPKAGGFFDDIKLLHEFYTKTIEPDIFFANTIQGTMEFERRMKELNHNTNTTTSSLQSKIVWKNKVDVTVFKGSAVSRSNNLNKSKNPRFFKKTEPLEDIKRVASPSE